MASQLSDAAYIKNCLAEKGLSDEYLDMAVKDILNLCGEYQRITDRLREELEARDRINDMLDKQLSRALRLLRKSGANYFENDT